jgi:hypothetical protein
MKSLAVFALLLAALFAQLAQADTVRDFVRIACVPEIGLLDVEFRSLHDSVSGDPTGKDDRTAILSKAGFHDPRGLKFSCDLGGVTYLITADQDETSERLCGGDPEVVLSVTRAGAKLFSNVVFGESCHQLPSVNRFAIGDGPKSWRGRETQVCYTTGKDPDPGYCDWTFGAQAQFDKRFPIDQDRIGRIVSKQEHR